MKAISSYIVAGCFFLAGLSATGQAATADNFLPSGTAAVARKAEGANIIVKSPPYLPVLRIPLRVHLAKSSRPPRKFRPIFEEINSIWWSQAGVCFEIHTVDHDETLAGGLDMWFSPDIGGYNGYYDGEYIQMSDNPDLDWAPRPAQYPAARTAAHELGHALNLPHRQESDDNLMRSKTLGWQLSAEEIMIARRSAEEWALADSAPLRCGPPQLH